MKLKTCKACPAEYTPTGPAAKYCPACADFRARVSSWLNGQRRTLKRDGKPRVGSGGQNEGDCHAQKYRQWFLMDVWYRQDGECYDCWTPLDPEAMLLHHVDHNRQNNVLSNLRGVCKRCHQIEHECWLAFQKGVTTIPKGSRGKRPEAHGRQ